MKTLSFILLILTLSIVVFGQRKTITNADLEAIKQKRIKAEQEYRENYKKLGMPSPEELEQREIERQQRLAESSRIANEKRQQNENYWQSQARILRSEIASVDAQINIIRRQISRVPNSQPVIYSYGYFPQPNYNYQPHLQTSNQVFIQKPNSTVVLENRVQNSNQTQVQNNYGYGNYGNINVGISRGKWRGNVNYNYGNYYGNYGYAYPMQNQNYQRDELVARFRLLEQQRAGLLAQWNVLEDEARRNGVKIY
ncbi:MAG: hypothetical protein MUC29_11885 [Pyrinomonadaceae bacterium]|jgi:hypothetical protein|nr:hypothetical protein [Pyrinomonadaceae bacterium]